MFTMWNVALYRLRIFLSREHQVDQVVKLSMCNTTFWRLQIFMTCSICDYQVDQIVKLKLLISPQLHHLVNQRQVWWNSNVAEIVKLTCWATNFITQYEGWWFQHVNFTFHRGRWNDVKFEGWPNGEVDKVKSPISSTNAMVDSFNLWTSPFGQPASQGVKLQSWEVGKFTYWSRLGGWVGGNK